MLAAGNTRPLEAHLKIVVNLSVLQFSSEDTMIGLYTRPHMVYFESVQPIKTGLPILMHGIRDVLASACAGGCA